MARTVDRVPLHAHVEQGMAEALRKQAAREDRSVSSVVRQLLRVHLASTPRAKG
jgi:hypothetical protein